MLSAHLVRSVLDSAPDAIASVDPSYAFAKPAKLDEAIIDAAYARHATRVTAAGLPEPLHFRR